ncbi:hypothetical protein [Nocardia bovistercoris]|uniref:Uncharacterized protein n=1 Tax=Nocardia bovistercoris TaxID=2785916 RepID=A0A931ID18_9NOCA|nr:hypothetical protein [Nocardia bovistercoris]MBH0778155.1 hypothetical protein [Nocardia bovistercoris]
MPDKKSTARRGTPPKHDPHPDPPARTPTGERGYPILCLRHLQTGWGIDRLTPAQCREFLVKWHKRTAFTWNELIQHGKHGLGHEQLPKVTFKPRIPEWLERDSYMVFRHERNLPFVGFRTGDVFHVLWIETRYGELYDH